MAQERPSREAAPPTEATADALDAARLAGAHRLRPARPGDVAGMLSVYRASVRLGARHYDAHQLDAWAAAVDATVLGDLVSRDGAVFLVAGEPPVAFGALLHDTVHMLYVHPEAAGQGVGRRLLGALEDAARLLGIDRLRVASSRNAVGFYAHHGYVAGSTEVVALSSVALERVRMEKRLG